MNNDNNPFNPFQPTNGMPPVLTPDDDKADDFAANSSDAASDAAADTQSTQTQSDQPSVTLDGISPSSTSSSYNPNMPMADADSDQDVTNNGSGMDFVANSNLSNMSDANTDTPEQNPTPLTSANSEASAPTFAAMPDPIDVENGQMDAPAETSAPTLSRFDALAEQADSAVPPKAGKSFSISILTLIFFVLTLAGAGGTVYFYLQNSENQKKLNEATAKVQELESNISDGSVSSNIDSNNSNALQDRIAELTTQNNDKQKTIDDQKSQLETLTTQNKTLTDQNADLTGKVLNINELTTKTQSMLDKLNEIYGN